MKKKIRVLSLAVITVVALSAAFVVAVPGARAIPLLEGNKAGDAPSSFADMAEELLPAVVNISSTQKIPEGPEAGPVPDRGGAPDTMPEMPEFPEGSPFQEFFNEFMQRRNQQMQALPASSLGSGFIIDADKGYIVTNNHVIKDSDDIKVTLHDDSIVPAKVLGSDEKTDLAVLQADLKGHKISAAKFGDSDVLRVGDWVLAIGNPFGLGGTVTAGIVSARKRDIQAGPYDDFIQTDASINRGNSGGPMFNMKGEVIGINTAIYSPSGGSVGIGFAIPATLARPVISQLVEFGKTKRGWIGVRIQSVTPEIAESLGLKKSRGALVAGVTEQGPAAKSGIKMGDVITSFNKVDVTEMRNLPRIVADTEIGTSVPVTVWRDGKDIDLKITVGELEKAEEEGLVQSGPADQPAPAVKGEALPDLGLSLAPVNAETKAQFALPEETTGLVVTNIDPKGDALRKGMAEGDVIAEMNQTPVATIADAKKALEDAKKSERGSILLLVSRAGDIQFIALKLK